MNIPSSTRTSQPISNSIKKPTAPKVSRTAPSKEVKTAATRSKAPAVKKAIQPAKPRVAVKPAQQTSPVKQAKHKLVRDSFTLPEIEHSLIKQCKKLAATAGRETKKSEVVRAALICFHALPVKAQMAAYGRLPAIAVGRPKK